MRRRTHGLEQQPHLDLVSPKRASSVQPVAMSEVPDLTQPAAFSTPVRYAYGPDSYRQPGVPQGTILDHIWSASRVFPGTNRRYWVYVPAQYTASERASLMVFQDGHLYLDPEGEMRVPIV